MRRHLQAARHAGRVAAVVGLLVAGTLGAASSSAGAAPARADRSPHGVVAHPLLIQVGRVRHDPAPPTTAECLAQTGVRCYGPTQLETAYDEQPLFGRGITGAGQTIVVVDSYGAPRIRSDLAYFDRAYGITTPPKFTVMKYGEVPTFTRSTGTMASWAEETTLDVEYAHTTAPGADILLVETASAEMLGTQGFSTIVNAENAVVDRHLGDVITQSFGTAEQTFEGPRTLTALRSAYVNAWHHDVTVLAASGDLGAAGLRALTGTGPRYFRHAVVDWPASDPLVTGVGGTALSLNTEGAPDAHLPWPVIDLPATGLPGTQLPVGTAHGAASPTAAWNTSTPFEGMSAASGGGYSDVFTRPSYQDDVSSVVDDRRGVPDIAMSASCAGAVNIYLTGVSSGSGWQQVCGTSEASPLFAGIVALADQEAHHPIGLINPALYEMSAARTPGIVAVTQGNNSALLATPVNGQTVDIVGYPAHAGYNLATGVGTVNAALFVPELLAAAAKGRGTPTTYGISRAFLPSP